MVDVYDVLAKHFTFSTTSFKFFSLISLIEYSVYKFLPLTLITNPDSVNELGLTLVTFLFTLTDVPLTSVARQLAYSNSSPSLFINSLMSFFSFLNSLKIYLYTFFLLSI